MKEQKFEARLCPRGPKDVWTYLPIPFSMPTGFASAKSRRRRATKTVASRRRWRCFVRETPWLRMHASTTKGAENNLAMKDKQQYELPKKIDHYLAMLAKLYAQEGKRDKEAIIVNALVRMQGGWSYDNWDGGITGHALYLTIPESLFLDSARQRGDLQEEIKRDLNKMHNVRSEFIEEVFLEVEEIEDQDWRRKSGLLQAGQRRVPPDAVKRIWGSAGYRVFLSHKAEVKQQTAELKERLIPFGICCFVAHEDVYPTKEWQDEIENALGSMDAFAALMTDNFHESFWTDQEVGFAVARAVPLIAVKLGKDPYGFIGKFQALSREWCDAPVEIAKLLIKQQRMLDAYIT